MKIEIEPASINSIDYPHRYRTVFISFKNYIIGMYLENCNLTYFPEDLLNFNSLTNLSLACNNIKKLPESLSSLTKLNSLNLSRNKLVNLPNFTPDMYNLENLNLNQNSIKNLPDSLFQLKDLKDLFLAYNKLEDLPRSISNLKSLRRLMIDGNKLKTLPVSVFEIKTLRMLYVSPAQLDVESHNQIEKVKKDFKEYVQSNIPQKDQNYITRYIREVPKLYIITPPYNIDFFYEFGGEMFWARNSNATLRFGSPFDPFRLPIPSKDAQKFRDLQFLWETLEYSNIRKWKHEIDYDSQFPDWERLRRETAELLIKISEELGSDFKFSRDFDYYMDIKNKMQELEGDISNKRVITILKDSLELDDNIMLLSIFKKKIFINFNEKELLEYLISLKLHGKFRFAKILVSEYLTNYSNNKSAINSM